MDNETMSQSSDTISSTDRISKLAGDNDDIADRIRSNILKVARAKQTLDVGQILLIFLYLAMGLGSRFIIWGKLPEKSSFGFYVTLITCMILVVIHKLTKNTTHGKLRDMIAGWYMFAQVGLIMYATYFQAYYYGVNTLQDLGSLVVAMVTWIAAIICIVIVHYSTKLEDLEVNPFSGFDIKKTYEWQRIRTSRDKKYGLLRDLFTIPVIYSVMKFFACLITNIIILLGGAGNETLTNSIYKFLDMLSYIDWGLVGVFFLLAIIYSIRFFVNKEPEKETTEYIEEGNIIFEDNMV